jgi:hypothetical protein
MKTKKPEPKALTAQLPEGAEQFAAPYNTPFATPNGSFDTTQLVSTGCYWTPRRPTYG